MESSPGMAEMWKAVDENLNICHLINPGTPCAIGKMYAKYPQTPVVVDHFARVGMAGPVTRTDVDRELHLSKHPPSTRLARRGHDIPISVR